MTQLAIGGIAVDHRIHIARGNAEEQVRFAQTHKVVFGVPVRLGDDADAETLRFQHPSANRHPKTRVIDVSIPGNQNDVAAIPAKLIHFLTGHRQERRRAETGGPILGPGEKVAIGLDQTYSAHNASGVVKK